MSEETNWNRCFICQKEIRNEKVVDPRNKINCNVNDVYEKLAENIHKLVSTNNLPKSLNLNRIDNGSGILLTFKNKNPVWHRSCVKQFESYKVKRKCTENDTASDTTSKRKSARIENDITFDHIKQVCFFCDKNGEENKLSEVTTFQLDYRVRKCVEIINDNLLSAKLNGGDLIAQEAKYHPKCLVGIYNKTRYAQANNVSNEYQTKCGVALAELITYMQESADAQEGIVFRLADLSDLYTKRLKQLGIEVESRLRSTTLKERLLMHLPGLKEFKQGRDVLLSFEKNISYLLREAYEADKDEQNIYIKNVIQGIRSDIFSMTNTFNGSYDKNCQLESVPFSLVTLINMLLNGANITDQVSIQNVSQSILTISQLVAFNIKRRQAIPNNQKPFERHSIRHETPIAVYNGLKLHVCTRKRQLVDWLHRFGLSISYNRVHDIVTALGNNVCKYYNQIGVVCPPKLVKGIFTVGVFDNINHNPSSNTSSDFFNGTGISMIQNISASDDVNNNSEYYSNIQIEHNNRKVDELPDYYTNIEPIGEISKDIHVPKCNSDLTPILDLENGIKLEKSWLDTVESSYEQTITKDSNISWAAYYANLESELNPPSSISVMLPLFNEEAASPSMTKHVMSLVKKTIAHINPTQVPVLCGDQLLYALIKQIQWSYPQEFGEDKFVALLGPLHIEQVCYKTLGSFLDSSGWTEILSSASIETAGLTAESFLSASHIVKTRYAHQVTAASLYIHLSESYNTYTQEEIMGPIMNFDMWCNYKSKYHPTFKFWYLALQFELTTLSHVRSVRSGNMKLYITSMEEICPWLYALNRQNYARWLPIHIRDMKSLPTMHPSVNEKFENGHFTMCEKCKKFSRIGCDHGHEHNNKICKSDGGIIGLTANSDQLQNYILSAPEAARIINEIESSFHGDNNDSSCKHHEQTLHFQKRFSTHVASLVEVIRTYGNPFDEDNDKLLQIYTKDIMPEESVVCLNRIYQSGQEQYENFVKYRLIDCAIPLSNTIKQNKVS